jgi:hypothetical protein
MDPPPGLIFISSCPYLRIFDDEFGFLLGVMTRIVGCFFEPSAAFR